VTPWLTAPNQLTFLRLIFVPLIVIALIDGRYGWALGLFLAAGLSDALDGLLARLLNQKTMLGQYLDPIADKLLMSTMFLVTSIEHLIPWKFTVLVFARDLCILLTCALLYATASIRDFRPSVFGKANTVAQVVTVFFVLLHQINAETWIWYARTIGLWSVFVLTLISGIHYALRVTYQVRAQSGARPAASGR
jgi:cardiolipin synthase (CMP-forming)